MARKTLLGQDSVRGLQDALASGLLTCTTAELVGHLVYVSSTNTVARAIATSDATSRVVGMINDKPSSTTCRVTTTPGPHLLGSGLVVGAPVYLSAVTLGGVTTTKPARAVPVGVAVSSTQVLLNLGISSDRLTKADKSLAPLTTSGNFSSTGLVLTHTPTSDSYVWVLVNGVGAELGDGIKTKDCYFSADGGVTARAIEALTAGDTLYWNGTIATFNLGVTDVVDLVYPTR